MRNKLLKSPKQLSFSFMRAQETARMGNLSKEDHNELIQALVELILTCTKVENPTTENHDDEC